MSDQASDLVSTPATTHLLAWVKATLSGAAQTDALRRDLSSALSHFLAKLVASEPAFRFTWFDGLLARDIEISDNEIDVTGALIVVNGHEWTMGPIHARFSSAEDGVRFRIQFLDRHAEAPAYRSNFPLHGLHLPEDDDDWAHLFEGTLPAN